MTPKEGKKALRAALQKRLTQLGFDEQKELIYTKAICNGPVWKLTFPCRLDQTKALRINCHVGVSYREIETVLRPGNLESGEAIATIMKPIHSLRDNGTFREWVFADTNELDEIENEIITDVRNLAVPFLEQFSDINRVESELQIDDPSRWFILDPEQRIATLVAIAHMKGETGLANEMVRRALEERANALPKKRRLLEDVAMRLNA